MVRNRMDHHGVASTYGPGATYSMHMLHVPYKGKDMLVESEHADA